MSTLRQRVKDRLDVRIDQIRREADEPLPDDMFDPVYAHLDALIDIVSRIQDFSTDPYLDKVRKVVCPECVASQHGRCARREAGTCGLDAYFPTIVATIEQVLRTDPGLDD